MAPTLRALLVSTLLGLASAQGLAGKTKEVHPKVTTYRCTKKSGCKKQTNYIVLDSAIHPIYQKNNPSLGCGNWGSGPNSTVCPDEKTCAKNCLIDGINNYSKHGVVVNGDSIFLDMLKDSDKSVLSPRIYLLRENKKDYEMLQLTGKEFSFDVDVSKLPCGMNGALYLSEMHKRGGPSSLNKAGAELGAGYCDAQCYATPFIDGVGNIGGKGACCPELDIWEANRATTHFAPHPCNITGPYKCTGEAECGWDGVCDEWGCGQNPYANGDPKFYGPGPKFKINTLKKLTVVTQFEANKKGTLVSYHRYYVQNGKKIVPPNATQSWLPPVNYMDDPYCDATGGATRYLALGATKGMGEALSRGMVLAMSVWWDEGSFMTWLDGGSHGPCNDTEGAPANIRKIQPDTSVTFSNIRWGDIGSTQSKCT
ncbi:endoglucanase type C [Drechslerella stenobrocha 248]|uniref:Glucanase n=1 Tax=Drechslerella stenobrocha 248 TaxID=1043628 RepID=W7HTH9_9PEZI|nr:endoglucanase type C [Drechslerella stenobrocha 248]